MKKILLYLAAAFSFLLISNSASAQFGFGAPNLTRTPAKDTMYVGVAYVTGVNAFKPTNTGRPAVSYAINGAATAPGVLSAIGLTFNSTTGELLGTPTTTFPAASFNYTATNANGTSPAQAVSIVVLPVAPPIISYTTPDVYVSGTGVDLTVTNSNQGITTSYVITSGTLPSGVTFNTVTGEITGVAPTVTVTTSVTIDIFANNTTGIKSGTTVTIIINPPAPLISYVNPAPYTVGTPIAALTPTNTGGPVATGGTTYGAGVPVASVGNGASGMAVDAGGNVYVTNVLANTITEYSAAGAAGAPVSVAGGPIGLVFDAAGNAYVLDRTSNSVVEYVGGDFTTAGTTIITGLSTPTGIAISGTNLYITNSGNGTIEEFPTTATPGSAPSLGIALTNGANVLGGIAVDLSGDIYVPQTTTFTFFGFTFTRTSVVEYNSLGTVLKTFNNVSRGTNGIYIDAAGNVYLTATGRASANSVTGTNLVNIATERGGLNNPRGIVTDAIGNLYVSDYATGTVTEYPKVKGYVLTGTLPPGLSFNTTTGVISGTPTTPFPPTTYTITAYNSSGGGSTTVTISCVSNPPVISYTPNPAVYGLSAAINVTPIVSGPAIIPAAYTTPGTALTGAASSAPWGMTKDAAGDIWVVNGNGTVDEYGPAGAFLKAITVTGTTGLSGITINNTTGTIYLSSTGGRVYSIPTTATGTVTPTTLTNTGANLQGIVYDPTTGFIYATTAAGNVLRITTGNRFNNARTLISGLVNATGITVDASGNIYVLTLGGTLSEYSSAGTPERTVLSGLGTASYGLYIDATGDYFISGNGTVKEYNTSGTLVSTTTTGADPRGIVTDASGDLYVADHTANTVTEYLPSTKYVLSGPALPAGVTFNPLTGVFGGSSPVAFGPLVFTVTVYGSGGTGTTTVTITCTNGPIFTYPTPDVYTQNTAITPLTPTVISGGPVTLYTAPILPAGLIINATTGAITGTPNTPSPASSYSITATSATGSTTIIISIAVVLGPPNITYSTPKTYLVGTAITALSPTNIGGPVTTYTTTGLPLGLAIDPTTGIITGSPTTVSAAANYSVTATNGVGSSTFQINITVVNLPVIAYTTPDVYIMGAVVSLTPTSTGSLPTTWSIDTPLPATLTFNTSTGVISGTATVVSATTVYTITATNANGSGTAMVSITVNPPLPVVTYNSPLEYTAGTPISPEFPTVVSGTVVSYSTTGLPPGLVLDPATGEISGTPAGPASAQAPYVINATNAGGSYPVTILIQIDAAGPVFAYTTPDVYPTGVAITPLAPVNSGSTPVSYTIIAGTLPTGLLFNTTTGVFTGTSAVASDVQFTILATDAAGTQNFALVEIIFEIADNWIGFTSTDWNVGTNWSTGVVPTATDLAAIGANVAFNFEPVVGAAGVTNPNVAAIIMGTKGTKAVTLTVNAGSSLNVTGPISYQSDASSLLGYVATIAGAGTVNAAGINVIANTNLAPPSTVYTELLTSSVANLNLSGNISLTSGENAIDLFQPEFDITGGIVALGGAVQTSNSADATSTFSVISGTLQIAGTAGLSGLDAVNPNNTVNFDNPGATIEYSGGTQTYYTDFAIPGLPGGGPSYNGITFSGSGIKSPTGTSSSNLNIDGNFTNAVPTDPGDFVDLSLPTVIFDGTTQSILAGTFTAPSTAGTTFYNTTFEGSGTATIVSGTAALASSGVLTMAGTKTLAAGAGLLTLNSDITGSATVATIPATCSITGTVNVQRFLTGGSNERGYRLLSSPVHVGASKLISMNYLINSCYIKGSGGTTGGFDGTGNPNLYLYRENLVPSNQSFISGNYRGVADLYTAAEPVINGVGAVLTNTNYTMDIDGGPVSLSEGAGYLFFFRGDRSKATLAQETALGYPPTNTTITATGTLNQGAVTPVQWYTAGSTGLGYSTTSGLPLGVEGFNLVGNPYASSINWDTYDSSGSLGTGISAPNMSSNIYVFDALSQNYNVYPANNAGVGTIANNSNVIPSGQGFFVQVFANNTAMVFYETAKINAQATAANGNLFLGTPAPAAASQSLHIKLTRDSITNRVNVDGIMIIFSNSASAKYVKTEDASYKKGSGTVSLASVSADSISLAINKMPFPTLQAQKIPLTVTGTTSGLYQLNLSATSNIPAIYTMWLKDAYKQDSLDIRANPIYSFNIDKSDTNTFGANRFSLVIRENPALMVHLLDFNATKAKGGSQVVWKTENEQNYTNFTVERSIDGGVTFAVLGGYASSALGTYSFLDVSPAMKANQYRLKIQDLNGTISYSKVITLIYGNGDSPLTASLSVYPNPSADVINVSIPSGTPTNSQTSLSGLQTSATTPGLVSTTSGSTSSYDIKIISITGSVIKSATSASTNWQGSVSGLAPGTYIIQVINNSNKSLVGRNTFVKL